MAAGVLGALHGLLQPGELPGRVGRLEVPLGDEAEDQPVLPDRQHHLGLLHGHHDAEELGLPALQLDTAASSDLEPDQFTKM